MAVPYIISLTDHTKPMNARELRHAGSNHSWGTRLRILDPAGQDVPRHTAGTHWRDSASGYLSSFRGKRLDGGAAIYRQDAAVAGHAGTGGQLSAAAGDHLRQRDDQRDKRHLLSDPGCQERELPGGESAAGDGANCADDPA